MKKEKDKDTKIVRNYQNKQKMLPAFPRTLHLPYNPNASNDDFVASEEEASVIFNLQINIEEKVDGASVGMHLTDQGNAILRNRDHILSKGYYKNTPAKEQFRPMWNWFYKNKEKFEKIREALGPVSVYGEWCLAQHGLEYDKLPDWFIAYDVYDYEVEKFLSPLIARKHLQECGFTIPDTFVQIGFNGSMAKNYPLMGYEALAKYANYPSRWAKDNARVEGIYLKTFDNEFVTNRFKMVRSDFVRGSLWNFEKINRNSLVKPNA